MPQVEEQDAGVLGEGSGQEGAPALAAREGVEVAIPKAFQLDLAQGGAQGLAILARVGAPGRA